MKKLQLLKTFLDLFYFFSILAILGMLVLIPIIFTEPEGFPIRIRGQEISTSSVAAKILVGFLAVSAFFFFYAIFLLRKTVIFFTKRDIFNPTVIANFNRIGKMVVLSSLFSSLPLFFYNMYERNSMGIEFSTGSFDSLFLSVSLGLFFMVLSEVFKIAKNLKDENELTV